MLRGLSLTVPDGEIVALLGSNGAGKTTTLRAITGLLDVHDGKVTKGSVTFDGERIDSLDPAAIVRRGIKQVMEGRRVFAEMTVDENLTAGGYTNRNRAAVATAYDRVMTLFPRLAERRKQVSGYLSGRRAADAGDRPRPDDRSQAARARRAVAGPRADARAADPRHHRRHQQAGHERPADRAERGDGAVDRHHRLHHGDRQGGDGRSGREAAARRGRQGVLPRPAQRRRRRPQVVPRRQALQAPQAVARHRAARARASSAASVSASDGPPRTRS